MSVSLEGWCRTISCCTDALQLLCKGVPRSLHWLRDMTAAHTHQQWKHSSLSQHCSGPHNSLCQLQQDLSLSSNQRQIAFGPVVPGAFLCTSGTCVVIQAALLWLRDVMHSLGRDVGRVWLGQVLLTPLMGSLSLPGLPPCCPAGRCESSSAPSPSSLVLWLKPIFVDDLRICSGGVEVCAHSVVCQLFSEENSLWQKRREFWDVLL